MPHSAMKFWVKIVNSTNPIAFGDLKQRRYKETGKCSICPDKSFYKVLIGGSRYVEFCKGHKQEAVKLSEQKTRRMKLP